MSYIPTQHAISFFDEFKKFLFKGNMIDMAVGIIIGGAFGGLVKSLVENVIMPGVTAITRGASELGPDGKPITAGIYDIMVAHPFGVEIPYGKFVSEFVNFLILGLVIYIVIVRFVGWLTKSKKEEAVAPPPPPPDVQLLTEIRDLLKAKMASPE